MKLETVGILIDLKPFGDRGVIAKFFTRDYGLMSGLIKGGLASKKNKPIIGQYGDVVWGARLDSQLGVFNFAPEKNMSVNLMMDKNLLAAMNSVFSLINLLLPEREKYEELFFNTLNLLIDLPIVLNKLGAYMNWEIGLLSELGYALDFSACSGCGVRTNLTHLSPKTGRAVCEKCAAPYIDRLYELPVNLEILKKFLMAACVSQGVNLPFYRNAVKF